MGNANFSTNQYQYKICRRKPEDGPGWHPWRSAYQISWLAETADKLFGESWKTRRYQSWLPCRKASKTITFVQDESKQSKQSKSPRGIPPLSNNWRGFFTPKIADVHVIHVIVIGHVKPGFFDTQSLMNCGWNVPPNGEGMSYSPRMITTASRLRTLCRTLWNSLNT